MKIAIIHRQANRSPKILAEIFASMLKELGHEVLLINDIDFLRRLISPFKTSRNWRLRWYRKVQNNFRHYFQDKNTLNELRTCDGVIFSECIPNAYWKNYYGIPQLKKKLGGIPVGLLEVFALDGATHFIDELKMNNDFNQDLYDFHLAVTNKSYTFIKPNENRFICGLDLSKHGFNVPQSKKFSAIVDFKWEGGEHTRKDQLNVLNDLHIPFIELEGEYTPTELRAIYRDAAVLFLQHYESFGMPIAECLGYGTLIATPNKAWPLAYRLGSNQIDYEAGELPECFLTYSSVDELRQKLTRLRDSYNLDMAVEVQSVFLKNYPDYFFGNYSEVERFCRFIKNFRSE